MAAAAAAASVAVVVAAATLTSPPHGRPATSDRDQTSTTKVLAALAPISTLSTTDNICVQITLKCLLVAAAAAANSPGLCGIRERE